MKNRKIPPINSLARSATNKPHKNVLHFNNTQKILLLALILILMMTTMPLLVVLFIGLLPTFTILVIDPKNINRLIIIGCFNLAGVFVYLFNILQNYTMNNALFIFSDVFNMIIMLGSAAIGLIIYYQVPMLFVYIAKTTNQQHIANIDAYLKRLKDLWGEDVVSK